MMQAEGTWTGKAHNGFFAKLFGKGPEPGEPQRFNLVALTADRLHILGAKPKSGRWKVTEPVGDWPIGDVKVHAKHKHETWRTHEHLEGPTDLRGSADMVKVTFYIKGRGIIKLESTVWDGDRLSEETVDALLVATGKQPLRE